MKDGYFQSLMKGTACHGGDVALTALSPVVNAWNYGRLQSAWQRRRVRWVVLI